MIAKRGYDPLAVLEEQAAILKVVDSLKLILDSDPRHTTGSGQGQAETGDAAFDPPAPPAKTEI